MNRQQLDRPSDDLAPSAAMPDRSRGIVKLQSFDNSVYERPNQPWVCGHSCGGCALGPTQRGACQASTECQPRWNNDSWLCNRSKLQGGRCPEGPGVDGKCCRTVPRCVPVLALRQRRARFVFWLVAGLLGLGLTTLSSSWRNEVLAPGGLTEQHAQLLRDKSTERCAECHGAATAGLAEWTLAAMSPHRTIGQPQSQLCLECHRTSLPEDTALLAHGMTVPQLTRLSQQAAQRLGLNAPAAHTATSQLACAACHREHHGAQFNLSAMTNEQCSTCHQDPFVDFAQAHPAFDRWPYLRRTRIAFDHAAHQAKHFPAAKIGTFDCGLCHEPGGTAGVVSVNGFEKACASCHSKKINQSLAQGVNILALPLLDTRALAAVGFDVGQWPAAVSGSFDGTIAPMTRLLLGSDRRAWAGLEQFGPDFDFLDIDPSNFDDLQAAYDIAWGIKQLLYDLTRDARGTFQRRLEAALLTRLSDQQAEALSAQLSPALISAVQRSWFPQLMREVPAFRRTMGLPADGIEADLPGPRLTAVGDLPVVTKLGSAGGDWHVDHEIYELSVRAKGHASAFVHSWIELLGCNSNQTLPETAWPLREFFVAPTGPGQCVSCHSVEQKLDRRGASRPRRFDINWHGNHQPRSARQLTKFSHTPHLLQPGLADCTACHQVASGQNVMASYEAPNPAEFACGFAPMSHHDCARCHHPEGAGDACLKCHNYHTGVRDHTR